MLSTLIYNLERLSAKPYWTVIQEAIRRNMTQHKSSDPIKVGT